jgi:NADPH:quinone reductase-like Zn-dependent oxidoreductase
MPRAVRFDRYGDVDVLEVAEVPAPVPGAGELLVRVKAAGINPGESKIREGLLHERWPASFPSGQGSDLAGIVEAVGDGVSAFAPGDAVLGWTDNRASQAELVLVEEGNATPKPDAVPWEVAGALFVAGATARGAVDSVKLSAGETLVVSGAAGGVGSIAVQLAVRLGVTVIGLASAPNHHWLTRHGAVPVAYGEGVADRLRAAAPEGVDAFIDTVGGGYIDLALSLGVAPQRIDTIIDFAGAQEHGTLVVGNAASARAEVLAELAELIAAGELEIPIARVYPLEQVRDAYRELEQGHTHGKIVLAP